MTEYRRHYPTPRGGALWYKPHRRNLASPRFPQLLADRRTRCSRITTAEILGVVEQSRSIAKSSTKSTRPSLQTKGRLATAREDTLRRLRSLVASHSADPKEDLVAPKAASRRGSRQEDPAATQGMPGPDFLRGSRNGINSRRNSASNGSTVPSPARSRQNSTFDARSRTNSAVDTRSRQNSTVDARAQAIQEEKPVAIGHGVSVSINLTEPVLFLQGFEPSDAAQRNTAMLRGTLHLKVVKAAKIKAVSLRFKGTASTKWPEGVSSAFTVLIVLLTW